MIIPGGRWSDLTLLAAGRPALIYSTATTFEAVLLDLTNDGFAAAGLSLHSIDLAAFAPPIGYTRGAADGTGRIATIGQSQRGDAILHIEGLPVSAALEAIDGERCCEIVGLTNGWRVFVVKPANSVAPRRVEWYVFTQHGAIIGAHADPTDSSQGFLSAQFGPLLTDQGRFYAPAGTRLLCLPESVDGELWVGQHPDDPPRVAAARVVNGQVQRATLFRGGGAGTVPHVVRTPSGRYWVTAWVPGGTWVETYSSADSFPWGNDDTAAPPTPTPDVPPIVVLPPEPSMQLPDAVKASRARFVAKFPVPQGAQGDAFEEEARQWSRRLAQQVRFDTGDARYGMKNAGGGRPTSKDTLAFDLGDGRIRIWDMLSGTGTGRPTLVSDPPSEDITGQVFEPQPAVNHVGGGTGTPDPGTPDPGTPPVVDPPPASGDVLALLAVINAKQDLILAKLAQPFKLEARL